MGFRLGVHPLLGLEEVGESVFVERHGLLRVSCDVCADSLFHHQNPLVENVGGGGRNGGCCCLGKPFCREHAHFARVKPVPLRRHHRVGRLVCHRLGPLSPHHQNRVSVCSLPCDKV